MPSLRLLKFDSVHPLDVLLRKQADHRDYLNGLSYGEYYKWLMAQRMGMSDFLTRYMSEAGWNAREVLAADDIMVGKLPGAGRLSIASDLAALSKRLINSSVADLLTFRALRKDRSLRSRRVLQRYVNAFQPHVIFLREPCHVKGRFWDQFRDRCLIVGLTGCTSLDPWDWNAHRHDVLFALTDEYVNYFRAEGIESHLFSYGVDERLAHEVGNHPKQHDCAFVGYLGIPDQRVKTKLMEFIAQSVNFKWWGIKGREISESSPLHKTWQGPVAGIEMFQIYKDSKIVVNEYPEMATSKNVNMRTMEVLNVGSFLLTRAASNIEWLERAGALVTFRSPEDCVAKIKQYLVDEEKREEIAAQGLRTALEHFNYRGISQSVMNVISSAYEKKRNRLKPWPAR